MSTDSGINLQATLSASSAMPPPPDGSPIVHHPIVCATTLRYDEDGSFACEHAVVGPDDVRTRLCIDHSISLLILEEGRKL